VTLQIEDDLSRLLQSPEQSAEQAARELIVLELYRKCRISSGRAAASVAGQLASKYGTKVFNCP